MIYLREITSEDISTINSWRNDPSLIEKLGAPFRYINKETDEKWFNSYMSTRNTQIRCAICDSDNEDLVGVTYLTAIDRISMNAEFHIMLGVSGDRGKGWGTMSARLMLHHAFYDMNLHRISSRILKNNLASIRLHEKCGFKKEGVFRDSVFKNGEYHDVVAMGLLKSDFIED